MQRARTWFPWILAVLVAAGVGFYQRRTGPTWPVRGRIEMPDGPASWRLPRSGTTGEDLVVEVPAARERGVLAWRRYPTADDWTNVDLVARDGVLTATLPTQPPAGKLEYRVLLRGGGDLALPADGPVIARFKGAVPAAVLVPHILAMFLSLVFGFRTAFGALSGSTRLLRRVATTVVLLTIGGMILGPCVQKYAFGEFWTGWPNGKDLTDNKTLLLWLGWLVALSVVRFVRSARIGRIAVVAASVVMVGVFLVPHSFRGSQLDYDRLDRGIPAEEAIETG